METERIHPMPAHISSPGRDRLQSRTLVWVVAPLLLGLGLWRLTHVAANELRFEAVAISLAFALLVRILRSATTPGAVCGALICLLLTLAPASSSHSLGDSGLPPLALLFVFTFLATRLGRTRKEACGLAEARTGRRASQVIANLGIAALLAGTPDHLAAVCLLAALAEATADTVSSEIGQAFGGQPILLTTLRRVPPGTDGAITLPGTLAGIAAAAVVAASAVPAMDITLSKALAALAAGTAGLFFDSLLGATLERRGWLGNDLVNFLSTAFSAAVALLAIRLVQP